MINTLEIKNFKSIKNLNLSCKRVNIFIGKPNVGKSNILEALGIFSFGGFCNLYPSLHDFIRFENLTNLFYDNELSEEIKISTNQLEFILKFEKVFIGEYKKPEKEEIRFNFNLEGEGRPSTSNLEEDLKKFKFYRFKKLSKFSKNNPEFLLPPHGENLLVVLLTHKELKSIVANIFEPYKLKISLKPQENKIEVIKLLEDVLIGYPYPLLSDTLQRVVFYLTAIESNKNSILVFEEPEAHAFPHYTKFLAERIALDNENQYFISTHNPYFLLSVLEKTKQNDISIFVVYFDDYQTKVKPLSKKELKEVLSLDTDIFFNIDRFLEE